MTNNAVEVAALIARLTELLTSSPLDAAPAAQPEPAQKTHERVLLTPEEAAARIGVGRTTMYRLIRTKEVESVQIGRLRRIAASEVDEYAARLVAGQSNQAAA
ncbi:helix-turn-helix domain-containing protein [Lentzea cavernae]|uniref:Excisionase n=1 Tax=Lentzea cavernae TaxID=2020703 RepID=A0ABQ3MLA5_9PSEU|nr:helix-turn-helix domain-containing protein [Lentzea cavernae]GHH49287.1 excisionase [Lentzea cavernae]